MKRGKLIDQLTLFAEEPRVRTSQSPDSEREWMATVATSRLSFYELLITSSPDGWYGKMSPESHQPEETLSDSSFSAYGNAGMVSPTEFSTLSISECHSGAAACSLSDILETGDVPQRYYLSAKACAGILRRAEKRGKELPEQLRAALESVVGAIHPNNHTHAVAQQVQWASGGGEVLNDTAQSVRSNAEHNYQFVLINMQGSKGNSVIQEGDGASFSINSMHGHDMHSIQCGMRVRRFTPIEVERLFGFKDDYTLVPHRGKPASDSARYKALGNSMAVPCMRWIGERIQMMESVADMADGE